MLSAELALSAAYRAAAATVTLGFLEQLTVFNRVYGPQGPFSPTIARIFGRWQSESRLLTGALPYVILLGAAAGLAGLFVGPYPLAGRLAAVVVLACLFVTKLRRVAASDGAEQMAVLILIAVCLAVVPRVNQNALTIAVWFIAGQSILSYITAGIAKAGSATWMKGQAVTLIMGSESYGQPWVSSLLESHPRLAKLLTRSVVLFECSFPLILIAPLELAIVILASGFLLHLGCAVTMGLNAFLFAFPGSYLCVAYVAQTLSPFW